jgi:hypothetical protein
VVVASERWGSRWRGLGWRRLWHSAIATARRTLRAVCHVRGVWLVCGVLSQSCGNRETLGLSAMSVVSAGVLNDPSNKTLRFDLLTFGMDRFCVEMLRRGAPIKLSDHEPVLGRFFAEGCSAQVIDNPERQSVVVRFSGKGFVWTNLTGRLGFSSTGLVEYAADFQLQPSGEGEDGERMYIYFRPKSVGQVSFEPLLIESDVARAGLGVSGVDPRNVGKDLIEKQLARGFTVIRHGTSGGVEFSPGMIAAGDLPFRPYTVVNSTKLSLDNDRTEVHPGQQDIIGGIFVADGDRRLFLSLSLDGAPAADVFVVPEADGQLMLQAYVTRAGPAPLPRAPLLDAALQAHAPLSLSLDIPPGNYFLVLDHSTAAGRSPPAAGQQAAKIDYLLQLGDR